MKLFALFSAATAAVACSPASAAIVSLASNVDLSAQPSNSFTVPVGTGSSYTFSYTAGSFSPVSIATNGNAQVFGNGFGSTNAAAPLQLDVVVPDQLSLGEFFSINGSAPISFSIALVNVALRFTDAGQTYYGYAQVGGSFLNQLAINTTPGASIRTGEPAAAAPVPEPATWAMMVAGFGLIGGALRSRRKQAITFA